MSDDMIKFFISEFQNILGKKPSGLPQYYRPRPYRNAAVQLRPCSFDDFEMRRAIAEETGLNVFSFPAHKIPGCDLLSDSGTTTMTMKQWSQLLLGDEAYGSNEGFFLLKDQIADTFGPSWRQTGKAENLFIFHQGRAAENALFTALSAILRKTHGQIPKTPAPLSGDLEPELARMIESKIHALAGREKPFFIIPSNSHFDTTGANIEHNQMIPLNLPCEEHVRDDDTFSFRGNMDIRALTDLLENERRRVPLIYLTITNNTGGGQPVSLANMRAVAELARSYGIPLFLDACRFAENAWFIWQREAGHRGRRIRDIVYEMFGWADGFHISLKKDGLVNMGGAIVFREDGCVSEIYPDLQSLLTDHQILTEGHPTYGGMAGRDLMGAAEGLKTVVDHNYLAHRIGQVERFGRKMMQYGIPLISPVGGHAVYIKADPFFEGTRTRDEDFKGVALTALLLIAGHRFCELGLYAFGKSAEERDFPPVPRVNLIRGAVPRLVYEDQDLFAAAEAVKVLYGNRDRIPGVEVTYGRRLSLRHFKSRFRFKELRRNK